MKTRFPPEPNGYMHIGHAKALCNNFWIAEESGGTCNLRFDDTNPDTESIEFVDSIINDINWLGFKTDKVLFASDYFSTLFDLAFNLIKNGLAYVDDQDSDLVSLNRGTVNFPGKNSIFRDRSVEENIKLFYEMANGKYDENSKTLRAKIDMAHPNMKMRDPIMYRIKKTKHYRVGSEWCIYPTYDWAHGQSDAIEGITNSICTLEFENNRELYDWFLNKLNIANPPKQEEYARLNLSNTILSKRHLKTLVESKIVNGWDDPRMPTISGMRNRGYTPNSIKNFIKQIGLAKANSIVDYAVLENCVRNDIDLISKRRMVVFKPVEVEIVNLTESVNIHLSDFNDSSDMSRKLSIGKTIYIESDDFMENPIPGFKRLILNGEVRLRGAHILKCLNVEKNNDGDIIKLICSIDHDTLGKAPLNRKVKGTIHWVNKDTKVNVKVNLIDKLFNNINPLKDENLIENINKDSLKECIAFAESDISEGHFQFERVGFFFRESLEKNINLVVKLKDSWNNKA